MTDDNARISIVKQKIILQLCRLTPWAYECKSLKQMPEMYSQAGAETNSQMWGKF
jgi:hypothetical protein